MATLHYYKCKACKDIKKTRKPSKIKNGICPGCDYKFKKMAIKNGNS